MFRRLRGKKAWIFVGFCLAAFVAMNGLAYRQAFAMTHFGPAGGVRTAKPEALSFGQKLSFVANGIQLPRPANNRVPSDLQMPFETWTIPVEDGVSLEAWHVLRPDSAGVVVLFHGYADRKSSVLAEAKAFFNEGWDPVLVDLRGSGGSSGSTTSIGFNEGRDVAAAVSFVQAKVQRQPLLIWGVSMGGAAALRAVGSLGSKAAGLIVEAPFATLRSAVINRFHSLGFPSFGLADLLVFWGGVQLGFNGFGHNPVEYAKNVTAPTLLLLGDHDQRVLMPEGRAIFDALAGPKEFAAFPGLGHESLVRGNRELWLQSVRAFLSRFKAASPSSVAATGGPS